MFSFFFHIFFCVCVSIFAFDVVAFHNGSIELWIFNLNSGNRNKNLLEKYFVNMCVCVYVSGYECLADGAVYNNVSKSNDLFQTYRFSFHNLFYFRFLFIFSCVCTSIQFFRLCVFFFFFLLFDKHSKLCKYYLLLLTAWCLWFFYMDQRCSTEWEKEKKERKMKWNESQFEFQNGEANACLCEIYGQLNFIQCVHCPCIIIEKLLRSKNG